MNIEPDNTVINEGVNMEEGGAGRQGKDDEPKPGVAMRTMREVAEDGEDRAALLDFCFVQGVDDVNEEMSISDIEDVLSGYTWEADKLADDDVALLEEHGVNVKYKIQTDGHESALVMAARDDNS